MHVGSIPGLIVAALLAATASAPPAATVVLEAGRDATLIQDPDGALANGSGPVFFAGRTSQEQNGLRRALLWFDVAGALPPDAVIEDARLVLSTVGGNSQVANVRLHRVLADWGEGASFATGGGGDDARPGDVTWLHTFYDDRFWPISGGQFVGRPSAERPVAGEGAYTWQGDRGLIRDIRLWLAAPQRNFGWIVLGDEVTRTTSKRFASRESPDPSLRPVLEIDYSRRPAPARDRPPRP